MISTSERRQGELAREHARVPCTIPVELTHDDRTPGFEADAVDLSAGGLSLRSASLPEVGATLHCRFDTLPGGTRITGRGEVVWAQPSGDRSGEFGLRFTHIDPRAQALISEMIAERVATGGIGAPRQPRMATLEFEENEGPITAKLTRATGRDVVFEQPLDVLALGRGVVAHAEKTLGHGNILRVDLRMDNGTPTLALTVRFSKEQEGLSEYGEYDWGVPESGSRTRAGEPDFLSSSPLPQSDVDTVPDLAAPLGGRDDLQLTASAADGGRGDDGQRVMTHPGGTLAPAQNRPAEHVMTRAGGMLAPAIDPLSPELTSAALARIEAEQVRQHAPALGTPLAAALAASNARQGERDTEPSDAPRTSARESEIRSLRHAHSAEPEPATAPGSEPAPDADMLRTTSSGTVSAEQQMAAGSAARTSAPGTLSASTPGSLLAFAPGSQRMSDAVTNPYAFAAVPGRDTDPSAGPEVRLTPVHGANLAQNRAVAVARQTTPFGASSAGSSGSGFVASFVGGSGSGRDTDPTSEPGMRATPAFDPRHTPALGQAAADGGGALEPRSGWVTTHSPSGAGLAGTAKQMDLTFAGEAEDDFTDADDYELHPVDDHRVRHEAIAVLGGETFSEPDHGRHTAPLQLRAAGAPGTDPGISSSSGSTSGAMWTPGTTPVDRYSPSSGSGDTRSPSSGAGDRWAPGRSTGSGETHSPSSGAGDSWSPAANSAQQSWLIRVLRVVAALVDGAERALGFGGRALKRVSDSVVPVLRRQLARRSTMRGVGPRVRRSAGTAPAAATTGWKLPRGSGRLVLLTALMIGCGILIVYAFPQGDSEQIDLHRQVQVDGEESADAVHATEASVNAATSPAAATAAASGTVGATALANPQLAAAGSSKGLNAKAGADASGGLVFGQKQVANAQRYVLRTNSPITTLHGKSDAGGFSVILPNTRAIDKAAPIALANPAVSKAKIVNKGGNAELSVRFAEGRSPAYRVSAQPAGLEVLIGN